MNPLAIAVQGIGFAVALVAVQGFAPDAVAPAVTPVNSGNYTTPSKQKPARLFRWVDEKRVAAEAIVPSVAVKTSVTVPVASGEGAAASSKAKLALSFTVPTAGGGGAAALRSSANLAQSGQMLAQGQHDIEDEDILAVLLSLLEEV